MVVHKVCIKKTQPFRATAFNHCRYCMVQPLFDCYVTEARPSLNRSISAVSLVQRRYALPHNNYRVYTGNCVQLQRHRVYAVPQFWDAYIPYNAKFSRRIIFAFFAVGIKPRKLRSAKF